MADQVHVWERHPATRKPMKYIGMMDLSAAVKWRNANGGDAKYVLNNIGPGGAPTHSVIRAGQHAAVSAKNREAAIRRTQERREAERAAYNEAERKRRVASAKYLEEREKREAAAEAERNSPEMQAMKKMAATGYEQHKQDEQDDLDAGINR